MKFALAAHGTRGDIEPVAAIGLELLRRGHDVRIAVAPNLVDFVEAAGLPAVGFGPDTHEQINALTDFVHNAGKIQNPVSMIRAGVQLYIEGWAEMGRTVAALANDADLLLTGVTYHGVSVNVAEHYNIPVAVLHYVPVEANGQLSLPLVPASAPLMRSILKSAWWLYGRITRKVENAQRRELDLPQAAVSARQRMAKRRSLEIQAYDEVCFPGLAAEWHGRRPFVGALTMDLASDTDDDVTSWIAGGTPPIYFGFGSTPLQSPGETIAMIASACAELGERALIYAGPGHCPGGAQQDHVKLVGLVNYATVLPACRAAVHHGGSGTTAAVMRAGIPSLILWDIADQPIWAAQIKRLKIGSARRMSRITKKTLTAGLRTILAPPYAARAREISARMSTPTASVAAAADLVQDAAQVGR